MKPDIARNSVHTFLHTQVNLHMLQPDDRHLNRQRMSVAVALIRWSNHETIQPRRNNQRYQRCVVIIISGWHSERTLNVRWVFLALLDAGYERRFTKQPANRALRTGEIRRAAVVLENKMRRGEWKV